MVNTCHAYSVHQVAGRATSNCQC